MTRVLSAIGALVLLMTPLTATDWATIAVKVLESIVTVDSEGGKCTGFVIDRERKYVLSAAHCKGEKLYADTQPARIVAKDDHEDLFVLQIESVDRPALKLAAKNPKIGEDVASYGYGYALKRPLFRRATVSDDKTYIPEGGVGGPYLAIDGGFIGGQSGGPVVNLLGEVVMIVQRSSDRMGLGVGAETIRDTFGKYFAVK